VQRARLGGALGCGPLVDAATDERALVVATRVGRTLVGMKESPATAMRAAGDVSVTEATLDEIARRVAELVADRIREPLHLINTETLARLLAVSEEWVREHAAELGAIRVGDSPKGALRFEAGRARAALDRRRVGRPSDTQHGRALQRRRSPGVAPTAIPADVKDW
jgi:hypothetical protein